MIYKLRSKFKIKEIYSKFCKLNFIYLRMIVFLVKIIHVNRNPPTNLISIRNV